MSNPFNAFNLSEFKRWIKNHADNLDTNSSMVGLSVRAKDSSVENFDEKISVEFGDEGEIVKQFLESGGTISEQDGNRFMIEVEGGSFVCHRRFLKRSGF